MHLHYTIELLKTFDEEELKHFGEFIRSDYFNKREALVRLFTIISKYYPDFTDNALKKENLYKKLYPGKEYNVQTLRNRMTELSSLIKSFLIQRNFEKDEFSKRKYFVQELTKRKLFDSAEKNITESIQDLEMNTVFGQKFFQNKLEMLIEQSILWNAMDEKHKAQSSAYQRSELTLNHFLLGILKINNDLICLDIETKEERKFSFAQLFLDKFDFEGYINALKEMNYEHYPLIAAYYYGNLTMMKPEDENYFFLIKELIYQHHDKFTMAELYNFWSILSNGVFTNYLKKGIRFMHEGHEINKFFIGNKIYDDKKPFSAIGYQNIAMNAIMINDLDWGEKFIEDFKDKLPTDVVDNRYHYCKALFCFERGNFDESIEHLNYVKYTDWHLKLSIRLLYLKNYYELGLSDQVSSLIDSIKHYIAKNIEMFPQYADTKIKNTVNYMSKMSNAKFGNKKLDFADLKEAEKDNNYLYKTWILEKMKELV